MQDIGRLVRYLLRYKRDTFLSIICHILMAVFTIISIPLIIPFFQLLFKDDSVSYNRPESTYDPIAYLKYYFSEVIAQQGADTALLMVCILIICTFFLKNLFRYLALFFMVGVRTNIVRDLRKELYASYIGMSVENIRSRQRGDMISRIISDVQEVEWSMLRFIDAIFKSPIIIIGSIFFMLVINVRLTMFVFILMAFTILVIGTLSRTLKKQSLELQNKLGAMSSTVDETIEGSIAIRVFRARQDWVNRFGRLNESFRRRLNRVARRQDLSSPLSEFLGVSLVVILLWYGAQLVLGGTMDSADFFAFIFAFYNVIEPSKSFATAYYNVKRGSAALQRIDEEMNMEQEKADAGSGLPFEFRHEIKFDRVSFSYGHENVLQNLSFTIRKGEKLAIVGPSGAGKTTIMNLLLKLLQPTKGSILVDGRNLRDIDSHAFYRQIGLVTQTPFLFNDTIRSNITLSRWYNEEEDLQKAIRLAHAEAFINKLPGGMDHIIGDRGDQLSGGEKQRLTIARALLEDPALLILDEPTSALDPEAEKYVSGALTDALKQRTAIIIAHRLSTIKYADRILVLDKGRIVEAGDHDELLALQGVYADYVKIQTVH